MRDEELERQIDAAMRTYAEPRNGLEMRALAAVAAARRERVQSGAFERFTQWRRWAVAVPVAACLLVAALVILRARIDSAKNEPTAGGAVAGLTRPMAAAPRVKSSGEKTPVKTGLARRDGARPRHRGDRAVPLPKQEMFPAPVPLSPELQAFADYVAHAPEKERAALVQMQASAEAAIPVQPLETKPIQIAPIELSAKSDK